MRRAFSLTIAASLAAFVAAPVIATAAEVEEYHSNTYNSEHTTVEQAPAVRERTTVETVPVPPVEQRRETETIVKKGHPHDTKRKVESKTKVEEEQD